MAEMRVAHIAQDLGTYHAMTRIAFLAHIRRIDRLEVPGPAATGLELGVRRKQRSAACHATVDAVLIVVPVASGKRALGRLLARDGVFHRRQLCAPLRVGLGDFLHRDSYDEHERCSDCAQSGGSAAYPSCSGCSSYGRSSTASRRATSSKLRGPLS